MNNLAWLPTRRDQLKYLIFGPTTVHFQHEFYLWVSVSCLTVASLHAMYKERLGSRGEYEFILLASIWLSRHLVIRWLVTRENSSSGSPSLIGVLSHWITSHMMAGQYFDRPSPAIVAKQIGTAHANDVRTTGGVTIASFFSPSILYTWQFFKVRIWFPLTNLHDALRAPKRRWQRRLSGFGGHANKNNNSWTTRGRSPSTNLALAQAYSYWNKFWTSYAPSLQLLIPSSTLALYIWLMFFYSNTEEVLHALTMNTRATHSADGVELDTKPFGAYQRLETPSRVRVIFVMSLCGTWMSILLYGRVILPIADLVAGSNVLRAVRNEYKALPSSGGKQSKSKVQRENIDQPYAEQYTSIVYENRFKLLCKISAIRLLENVFVCAVLPRTKFACRFTGHCPEGASLMELTRVFFPVGITSALRDDTLHDERLGLFTPERISTFMALLSVVIITCALLVAQAATLNRSYLGIMGYITGEWTLVDSNDPSVAGATPSPWDPRRRYRKGDLIVQNYAGFGGGQSIYRATSNSPEGRPFDLYLRATHDLFRDELGHPATSTLIAFASIFQICLIAILVVMIFFFQMLDHNCSSLVWTLIANLVAAYGNVTVNRPDYTEYGKIAQEIGS